MLAGNDKHLNIVCMEYEWFVSSRYSWQCILLDGQGQMKNEKVAEPSDLVQEKVKSAREAGIDMITGLVNQITEEGFIPEE